MSSFSTFPNHGYDIKFSPFQADILTVATSENFGFSGAGALLVLKVDPAGGSQLLTEKKWRSNLFCATWCTSDRILTGSVDGSVQIWSLNDPECSESFIAHQGEISSVECVRNAVLTASWDQTLKLYDLTTKTCVNQFRGHQDIIYRAKLCDNGIISVSADKTLKLWSSRAPHCLASIQVHDSEVLCCDWNQNDPNLIATSGSDSLIRVWDLRHLRQPAFQLKGGNQAVKNVKFSPHFLYILGSSSFDGSTSVWDIRRGAPLEVFRKHSGFVYGLDWSEFELGLLCDCAWDSFVQVFWSNAVKTLRNKI
ncbi:peroxisomal targeting signal 2 receptor [Anthonomus grandis grandis]|uniref:peroxisomal targeting signal 2 receptor n=1 Tax=Anthonomus grandis grandis TaxID=2921223 RepID=UPI002165122C|nr:peroxisomal targeting signal 2 receptor [Anthonomus grandis grandis]